MGRGKEEEGEGSKGGKGRGTNRHKKKKKEAEVQLLSRHTQSPESNKEICVNKFAVTKRRTAFTNHVADDLPLPAGLSGSLVKAERTYKKNSMENFNKEATPV